MNKKIVLLAGTIVVFGIMLWVVRHQKPVYIEANTKSVATEISKEKQKNETKKQENKVEPDDQEETIEVNQINEPNLIGGNPCLNEFKKQNPEIEGKFNQKLAEFYLGEDELMGEGTYTTMDALTLEVLANSGDLDAAFVHGTNLVFEGIVGVRLNRNTVYDSVPAKDLFESHKIDFEKIERGNKYLFDSAVKGKLGAFLEINMHNFLLARHLQKKSYQKKLVEDAIQQGLAYQFLTDDVHQKDTILASGMREYYYKQTEKLLTKMYPDDNEKQITQRVNEISQLAKKDFEKLQNDWYQQRESLGLEIYPDLLDKKMEMLVWSQQGCDEATKPE